MSPGLRRLYALWHQPGRDMDAGWWDALELAPWREAYAGQALLRPPLDALIARRLRQTGPVPALSGAAAALLDDDVRRHTLCLALGLWALRCPDYLLLKPYREALSTWMDARAQSQLQTLLPQDGGPATLEPHALPQAAAELGAAWLADAADPALRLCRLLWPPSSRPAPAQPVAPVLLKLTRWL